MKPSVRIHVVALAVLACLLFPASLNLSKGQLGGKLDFHHGWLTAHALLSLKAYDDFGFFNLAGLSCVIPKTPEWNTEHFGEKVPLYISFPMLHLIAPYAVYKLISLATPAGTVALDFPFLQAYHLAVNRLLALLALYFALSALTRALFPGRLGDRERAGLAVGGCAVWLFTPGGLFFTQNVSFSDMAVFAPAFAYMALLTGADFGLSGSRRAGLWIGAAAFCACAMDWYGYVVCGLGLACSAWSGASAVDFSDKPAPTSTKNIGTTPGIAETAPPNESGGRILSRSRPSAVRAYAAWRAAAPSLYGAGLATAMYVFQLLARGNRFGMLWDRILLRTQGANLHLKPADVLFSEIFGHFKMYVPDFFRDLSPFYAGAAVILIPLVLFVPAWLYARKSGRADKRRTLCCLALWWLAPLAHIWILRPHSAIHDFSALKIAVLPALGAMGLAVLAALAAGKSATARAVAMSAALILALTGQSFGLQKRYDDFVGNFDNLLAYGAYFRDNFPVDQVLVSRDFPLLAYPNGDNDAVTAWTAKRSVYPPWTYCEYREEGLLRDTGKLAFLFDADKASQRDFEVCGHLAHELPRPVGGKTALACAPDPDRLCLAAKLDRAGVPAAPQTMLPIDALGEGDPERTPMAAVSGLFELESAGEKRFRWASGKGVDIVFELARQQQVVLAFLAESFIPGQTVAVEINGDPAWTVQARREGDSHTPDYRHLLEFAGREGVNVVKITFADYNGKTKKYIPGDSRPLAVAFSELSLSTPR